MNEPLPIYLTAQQENNEALLFRRQAELVRIASAILRLAGYDPDMPLPYPPVTVIVSSLRRPFPT